MQYPCLRGLALCALASGASAAQQTRSFPLHPDGTEPAAQGVVLRPDLGAILELAQAGDVVLEGLELPGGARVDLRLERLPLERLGLGLLVDGAPRPDLLPSLELSLWKGEVVGEAGSSAMLSFSAYGSRGWVQRAGELVHLLPRPGAGGDWTRGDVLLATEASLERFGARPENTCELLPVPGDERGPATAPEPRGETQEAGGPACGLKECTVAIESDWQLYQQFGSLPAMSAYVVTLLGFVSDRYETQVGTVLTFPYMQFYTSSSDPWTSQDSGGSCTDLLFEFQAAWAGSIPTGARIGHFLSGANLGCGVAWLDVLCSDQFNFSVSGNMNGDVQFPVAPNHPANWDFMVVAHELGHNFASPHTHDYCPPLDQCAPGGYFGQCQTQQVCTSQGTIMSYCHLCSGGLANITTFFHPTAAAVMTGAAQACLPDFAPIDVDAPSLLTPGVATPVSAQVGGTPTGAVALFYRYQGGAFSSLALTDQGGGLWTGALPPAHCGDTPEYYYAYDDLDCGAVTSPPGAPGSVYAAGVGTLTGVFADDFETDQGWVPVNLGASSGDWERGVPVNDPNWDYDPAADYDGSGSCWLTENQFGNTDVDDGAVRLSSPVIDMSGGEVLVSYAYFLRLTNDSGADRLLVEVSSNGAAGPWSEIARHDSNGGLSWRTHSFGSAELLAAGVAQTATMQLRFTANDANPQSIVEAAIDAFDVSIVTCDDGGIGTNYCQSGPNSTGLPAVMDASGSASIAANDLVLHAETLPSGQNGLFYYGPTATELPFGNGFRCVAAGGVGIFRLPITVSDGGGKLSWAVDNTAPPSAPGQLSAGSTWFFQAWFRDPAAGGAAYDLSDGYEITFEP